MRHVVLDTETTGLDATAGERIVEIGAVEVYNYIPTGQTYQCYINPEKPMPHSAQAVHGLSTAFLADKPKFSVIVDEFLRFIANDPLVIHNAPFDVGFLNAELQRLNHAPIQSGRTIIDTLDIARQRYPHAPASLDALCQKFDINNTERTYHGALLDAHLLALVYLELQGGQQPGLGTALSKDAMQNAKHRTKRPPAPPRPRPLPAQVSNSEKEAHATFVREQIVDALWHKTN